MKKFFFFFLFVFWINIYPAQAPKNIIIFIGDGMGVNYISASLINLKNDPFRRFTSTGFSVTCSADNLVTDSGAGATAIATGYRTNNYHISIHPETNEPMFTIIELAESLNKSTGVVVTSSVTHATPAAFLSHVEDRSMQIEIAKQITDRKIDVLIGGGKKFMTPKSLGGDRLDEINLVNKIINNGYNYYDSYEKIKNNGQANKFYALLESDGLLKAADRDYSLSDLTNIALNFLNTQPNGFILVVEGSQIDWAGHAGNIDYILSEMKDFNEAINTALDFAEGNGETLVLVTADHETGGMNIFGGDLDGCKIDVKFSTGGHTADIVPVFAKGPGEEEFRGIIDNYMIGRKLFKLLDNSYQF